MILNVTNFSSWGTSTRGRAVLGRASSGRLSAASCRRGPGALAVCSLGLWETQAGGLSLPGSVFPKPCVPGKGRRISVGVRTGIVSSKEERGNATGLGRGT